MSELCRQIHARPALHRAQCCGQPPAPGLQDLCTQVLGESLARGAVTLVSAEVEACAGEQSASLPGCDRLSPLLPPPPASCLRAVQGRRESGEACHGALECRQGLHCAGARPGQPGRCAPPSPPGTSCEVARGMLEGVLGVVDDGAHPVCDGLCLRGRCVARAGEGQGCAATSDCRPGLACVEGACRPETPSGTGSRCGPSMPCAAGLVCSGGLCAEAKPAGAACTTHAECASLSCLDSGFAGRRCADACRPAGGAGRE